MIDPASIKRIISREPCEFTWEQNLNTTAWGHRRKPEIRVPSKYREIIELVDGTIIVHRVPASVRL